MKTEKPETAAPAQNLALDRGECYGAQLNNGVSLCQGEESDKNGGELGVAPDSRTTKIALHPQPYVRRQRPNRIPKTKPKNVYLSIAYADLTKPGAEIQVKTREKVSSPSGALGGQKIHQKKEI